MYNRPLSHQESIHFDTYRSHLTTPRSFGRRLCLFRHLPKYISSFNIRQRVALSHAAMPILNIEATFSIKRVFTLGRDDRSAYLLFLGFLETPLHQLEADALSLGIGVHSQKLEVPGLAALTSPDAVEEWVRSLYDIFLLWIAGPIRPQPGVNFHSD